MKARIQKISKYAPSIFQGKIDFAAARRTFSLTIEHPAERVVLRAGLISLGAFAFLYVYFVGASILNVIARKEALSQTANLSTAVSELEREYFTLSKNVTPEKAARLGLSPVSNTAYVYTPGSTVAGTLGSNEI